MTSKSILPFLKKELTPIFKEVADQLAIVGKLDDRELDRKVKEILTSKNVKKNNLEISFKDPEDAIYDASKGRTSYDCLMGGKFEDTIFHIFLNNKLGDLSSKGRNDTTTYNNLLRLYLGTKEILVKEKTEIDPESIRRKVLGKEVASYAIFVVDKYNPKNHRFFFLEEMDDKFYVNPRNNMFQIRYDPPLRSEPLDFVSFIELLFASTLTALNKTIEHKHDEIKGIERIDSLITELIENVKRCESV